MKIYSEGNAGEEPNRRQKGDTNRSGTGIIRRTLEGHTRPCEDCGVTDWQMDEIGRAHVRTPVTEKSRMPSSA